MTRFSSQQMLILASLAFACGPVAAQSFGPPTRIVLSGMAAPGGGTYSGFIVGTSVLNASGEVAFVGSITGGTSTSGVFAGTAGSIQAVALLGNAAPSGGNYSYFGSTIPNLNAAGQVAFSASLSSGTSSQGIFAGTPAALQTAALLGTASPSGSNYYGFNPNPILLNAAGQVAFSATLASGQSGIFAGAPSAIQAAAVTGTAAPAGGNYSSALTLPNLSASGQVAFTSNLSASTPSSGLFTGAPGSIQAAVLQGSATPAGGTYSTIATNTSFNGGKVMFAASLSGTTSTYGVFAGSPGALQTVALQGNAAPSGGTYYSIGSGVIDGSGQVLFRSTNFVNSNVVNAMYGGSPGALQPVVVQGNPAPAGGNYDGGITTNLTMNAAGQVAYIATLTGGSATSGLFAGAPGNISAVVITGQVVDVDPGPGVDDRTVSNIWMLGYNAGGVGSGGQDGKPICFNDSGLLVYELQFTDGSYGIFTSQIAAVPEPGGVLLAGSALLGLLTRPRKRRLNSMAAVAKSLFLRTGRLSGVTCPTRKLNCELLEDRLTPAAAFSEFVDPHPTAGDGFGKVVVPLSTGNVVITAPYDNAGGTDAGAVYLFNGATGALISTLNGADAYDEIGYGGIVALTNGNFVIDSQYWNGGGGSNGELGAVTLASGITGINGFVNYANSLVGSTAGDDVGNYGVTALSNGNYVVDSPDWSNGSTFSVGAVTFGNGVTGVTGAIYSGNSLIGNKQNDSVGYGGITALSNGNYVVVTQYCASPTANLTDVGAVTFGNGTTGVSGNVSSANSLIGSATNDEVGNGGVVALPNGNYVVDSPNSSGGSLEGGAVTFCSGTSGKSGTITSANSLVGSFDSEVGGGGITVLTNGNYVVSSYLWNSSVSAVGAVTWGSGTSGVSGAVSASNSLIGSTANDKVGYDGVTPLTNGNYVVGSSLWHRSTVANAGAATWCNGASGTTVGAVSISNSLVGSTANDEIGYDVTALTNGNYVEYSEYWSNGSTASVGAVTWGNGASGTAGAVSSSNSLIGSTASDRVGYDPVTPLSNGNYVVQSPLWHNGAVASAGAATWCSGSAATAATVSAANSLVGSTANDLVGYFVFSLGNGNYVVGSPYWSNGTNSDAGASTFGSGTAGVHGAVSSANSLVGTMANDEVGYTVYPLSSGNYVSGSVYWHGYLGAATWASGTAGIVGAVSSANSLVGSTSGDEVGNNVIALTNGNYIVESNVWHNAAGAETGAVTFGYGAAGTMGTISSANSLIGSNGASANAFTRVTADNVNNTYLSSYTGNGLAHVFVGSQLTGVALASTIYLQDYWSTFPFGTTVTTVGNQSATIGVNAFATLPLAEEAVTAGGTISAQAGTYTANTSLAKSITLNVPSSTVYITGVLSGPGRITKTGNGTVSVQSSNTFTGGWDIEHGELIAISDAALGPTADTTTVNAPGELLYVYSTTTARDFDLNDGTLAVYSGATLTSSGAEFDGGFITGPGTITTANGTSTYFYGSTLAPSLTITDNGSDSYTNVSSSAAITAPSGQAITLTLFTNQAGGSLTLNGYTYVSDFITYGQATINGVFTNQGSSGLDFGGGSLTYINSGATVNIGNYNTEVSGAFIQNKGAFGTSGSTSPIIYADYGSRIHGLGTYGSVITRNGGIFDPNNSPGTSYTNQLNVNGGGIFEFQVTNAAGSEGNVSGWTRVLVQPTVFSPTSANLALTATATSKYTILLTTEVDDGVGDTPGVASNFNPSLSYAWKFADATNAATTFTGSFNAADFSINTTAFTDSFNGSFSVQLPANSNSLYIVYTPMDGPPVPTVSSVIVNGGAVQRSRLTSITVNFQNPIDASTLTGLGAVKLTSTGNYSGGPVGAVVQTGATGANGLITVAPASGLVTSITLTFSNANGSGVTGGVEYGSLADGEWQLSIPSIGYTSATNDPNLHRLFGDINGDGTVDALGDQLPFGAAFGTTIGDSSYNAAFDFNNDGTIDALGDQLAFGGRFGQTLP